MNLESHNLTDAEMLRFYPDSPLAESMQRQLERLQGAGVALSKARDLVQRVRDLDAATREDSPLEFMAGLAACIEALVVQCEAFEESDDGELGS